MYMEVDKIGGCATKKREGKVRKYRAFNKNFEKFTIFADFVSNYLVLKDMDKTELTYSTKYSSIFR